MYGFDFMLCFQAAQVFVDLADSLNTLEAAGYFPMQKRLKICPSTSSLLI
jgi:hypothetical protein